MIERNIKTQKILGWGGVGDMGNTGDMEGIWGDMGGYGGYGRIWGNMGDVGFWCYLSP